MEVAAISKFHFHHQYPEGVQLSKDIVEFLDEKRKTKSAITFDEATLEGKVP